MRVGLLLAIVSAMLICGDAGRAQDVPPKDVLDAILRQFRIKLPATGIAFRTLASAD